MENHQSVKILVRFKPKGVESYESSEIKEVNIEVSDIMKRSQYYKIATQKCLDKGIIDKYGMKYWTPYSIRIYKTEISDSKRDECIEIL